MGCVSPPLSLIQNRTGDFAVPFSPSQTQCIATASAVHCNRSCSALHPSLQCTASFPANVCIRHRKRLHPPSQTLSSRVANVIILGCKRYPLCGPKNHSFADMGPRVKKYGIRASALSGYQSDAGTVSRVEDIAQPHWSALLGRR